QTQRIPPEGELQKTGGGQHPKTALPEHPTHSGGKAANNSRVAADLHHAGNKSRRGLPPPPRQQTPDTKTTLQPQAPCAYLAALGKQTEDIKIRVDPEGVYDDVAAIDAALESIRDKRVGVDITEREALAQIATVSAAAEALDDQDVDITVDVDRDRLVDFSRN